MSNQMNKQIITSDCRYWHIEGNPLFANMERHM